MRNGNDMGMEFVKFMVGMMRTEAQDDEIGEDTKLSIILMGMSIKAGEISKKIASNLTNLNVHHLLNNVLMAEKVLEETEKEIDRLLKEAK